MTINYDNPMLYEHLGVIIDAFEKRALKMQTRESILALALGPLTGMELIARDAKKTLTELRRTRQEKQQSLYRSADDSAQSAQGNDESVELQRRSNNANADADFTLQATPAGGDQGLIPNAPNLQATPSASFGFQTPGLGFQADPDLAELFAGHKGLSYLSECLGCNARLRFDWQLQPLNLLGPLNSILNQLNFALDQYDRLTDPRRFMDGLCDMADTLEKLCLPDITMMVMSLKFLLGRYISNQFDIRLDWTSLVGGILLLIVKGIMALVNQLASVIVAPLDCVQGMLATADRVINESLELAQSAIASANEAADFVGITEEGRENWKNNFDFDTITNDFSAIGAAFSPKKGKEKTERDKQKKAKKEKDAVEQRKRVGGNAIGGDEKATGFSAVLTDPKPKRQKLDEALQIPEFFDQGLLGMVQPALNDAREEIVKLVEKLREALENLQFLVGGGLSLQLGQLGTILFLMDMIKMIMNITRMLQLGKHKGKDVKWCEFLDKNPDILVGSFRTIDRGVVDSVERRNDEILLRVGPETVGSIKTCGTVKTAVDQNLIQQWIRELEDTA